MGLPRFATPRDLLERAVPSIVIGIFAWALVVVPLQQLFGPGPARSALGIMLIPISIAPPPSRFFPRCRTHCGEGAGAGSAQVESAGHGGGAGRHERPFLTGMILGIARPWPEKPRRLLFHRAQQPILAARP